jgi:hypothetical protein
MVKKNAPPANQPEAIAGPNRFGFAEAATKTITGTQLPAIPSECSGDNAVAALQHRSRGMSTCGRLGDA